MANKKLSLASAKWRVLLSLIIGIGVGAAIGLLISWKYAPLAAWDIAALIFLVWLYFGLQGLSGQQTADVAKQEDPGRTQADIVLVFASLASLAAVFVLLAQAQQEQGILVIVQVGLGVLSVVISWTVVHAVYALRYAEVFFKKGGGVDFNDSSEPTYSDFAYLAFTVGMTFQVSDTTLKSNEIRRIALRHALLSYIFGTVIVASTISLITGLGK